MEQYLKLSDRSKHIERFSVPFLTLIYKNISGDSSTKDITEYIVWNQYDPVLFIFYPSGIRMKEYLVYKSFIACQVGDRHH